MEVQKKRRSSMFIRTLLLLWGGLMLSAVAVLGEELPLHEKVDALYARSQKMVEHGRHGHTGELVDHAKVVMRDLGALIDGMEANKGANKPAFTRVTMELMAAKASAAEAVRAGEARQKKVALLAARKAFFQIKRARQHMEKMK
jgi:hypothetical protein